jgi:predicted GIY-YIG superfamily endonuclease
MAGGYIYILGSHTGTLYIGVTSNLYLRVMQQSRVQRPCTKVGIENDYSA